MNICREFRDYVQLLKGNYVPTEAKLRSMVESGFVFPETCKAILKQMEVMEMMMSSPAGHHNPSLGIHVDETLLHRWPRQWTTSSSILAMRRWGIN